MRKRFVVISAVVPIAVGAIIAAYSIRQTDNTGRLPVPSSLINIVGERADRVFARVTYTRPGEPALAADARIRTHAQARAVALNFARAYGTGCSHVVAVELLTLADAMTRTQRDPADELDLGAACYGEASRLAAAWRVQLDDVVRNGSGLRASAAGHTAILVLAAGVGTLIDMTIGYPVPQ
jgi:hypothetical protein